MSQGAQFNPTDVQAGFCWLAENGGFGWFTLEILNFWGMFPQSLGDFQISSASKYVGSFNSSQQKKSAVLGVAGWIKVWISSAFASEFGAKKSAVSDSAPRGSSNGEDLLGSASIETEQRSLGCTWKWHENVTKRQIQPGRWAGSDNWQKYGYFLDG